MTAAGLEPALLSELDFKSSASNQFRHAVWHQHRESNPRLQVEGLMFYH